MAIHTNWQFTLNNYTQDEIAEINEIECKYVMYGKEEGKNGTPHLQGLIVFNTKKSQSQLKKLMPRAHVEIVRNLIGLDIYNRKDGDIYTRGERPMTQTEKGKKGKEYWDTQLELIKTNSADIDSKLQVMIPRNIEFIQAKEQSKKKYADTTAKMLWYYGPSGSGKSRKARTEYPDAYLKQCNKWWDHYNGEQTVIIEDFDKRHDVLCHHLKIWADRYPFLAEFKGGAKKIRPLLIIVTSNWHPMDIWTAAEDIEPICRRFEPLSFPLKNDIKEKKRKRSPSPQSQSKKESPCGDREPCPEPCPTLQEILDDINQ